MKISIIVPCYNEENTIGEVITELTELDLGNIKKEIIIVDDGSTDRSPKIIREFQDKYHFIAILQDQNKGKGSALRVGFGVATGDIIAIQDGDLELNPTEYKKLIEPIINGEYKVVYGSRYLNRKSYPGRFVRDIGVRVFAFIFNILYGTHLTDTETCYKIFKSDIIKNYEFISNGFAIDLELTSKFSKDKIAIKELPISYYPRSIAAGKKNGMKDGIMHFGRLVYFRYFN